MYHNLLYIDIYLVCTGSSCIDISYWNFMDVNLNPDIVGMCGSSQNWYKQIPNPERSDDDIVLDSLLASNMTNIITIVTSTGPNSSTCGYCGPPGGRSETDSSHTSAGLVASQLSCEVGVADNPGLGDSLTSN